MQTSKQLIFNGPTSVERLDGADLRDADLRFSSLKGIAAGSDLQGAQLDGTDLRQADLSGSVIQELERATGWSHWNQPGPAALRRARFPLDEAGPVAGHEQALFDDPPIPNKP